MKRSQLACPKVSSKDFLAAVLVSGALIYGGCGSGVNAGISRPVLAIPSQGGDTVIGDSCRSSDPQKICLAVRYVAYKDSNNGAAPSRDEAINNIRRINAVWAQCNVAFQIEEYLPVNPAEHNLLYQTTQTPELDDIRREFQTDDELLVTTTGPWNRTGTLGKTSANAWTAMPGGGPFGAVLERPVATYANIIAHELGHYLGLGHVTDSTDLMNPIIYSTSTDLSQSQCDAARSTAKSAWSRMLRMPIQPS